MIIASYAGVGKSTFATQYPDETRDLYSMPFKWILPEAGGCEFEAVKAAPYLLRDPAFPDNYMAAVLEAEQDYKYVLIPTIRSVLEELHEACNIPYVICYPNPALKEEYRSRYLARGNTQDFLNIFINQWDERIRMLMEDESGVHIRLESGMFLTDVKDKIDSAMEAVKINPIDIDRRNAKIDHCREKAQGVRRQGCVSIRWVGKPLCYFPLDLNNSANRQWIFELEKCAYKRDICLELDDVQFLETFYDHECRSDSSEIRKLHNMQEVMMYLAQEFPESCDTAYYKQDASQIGMQAKPKT